MNMNEIKDLTLLFILIRIVYMVYYIHSPHSVISLKSVSSGFYLLVIKVNTHFPVLCYSFNITRFLIILDVMVALSK